MKIVLASFVLVFSNLTLAAVDSARFDGEYKLVRAQGTAVYNRVKDCTDPVVIGPNTLDARGMTCSFQKVKQDPKTQCYETLFIHAYGNVISYGNYDVSTEGPYGAATKLVDQNENRNACDNLNFLVCLAIKHTDFYDETINSSRTNSLSNYKRNGYNKDFVSLQKTTGGLVMGVKKTHYWASSKAHPDLMETADVKCTYTKVAP